MFKFLLNIHEKTTSGMVHKKTTNSEKGRKPKETKVFIWNVNTMTSKTAFQSVDAFFKDLMDNDEPFGKIIVILAGDFLQTLPIIRQGKRFQIIGNTVKKSQLWNHFETIKLFDSKRLNDNDQSFKQWLLDIGEGIFKNSIEAQCESIKIPNLYILRILKSQDPSIQNLSGFQAKFYKQFIVEINNTSY